MTICLKKESPATLESLRDEATFEKINPLYNSDRQVIVMPHQDDGLSPLLSGIVCLSGSWVRSDKGAT